MERRKDVYYMPRIQIRGTAAWQSSEIYIKLWSRSRKIFGSV